MKYKCLGIQSYDFTGKEGNQVKGNKLFVSEIISSPMKGLTGLTCEIVKINDELLANLIGKYIREDLIGNVIDIQFNSKGYLSNATFVK